MRTNKTTSLAVLATVVVGIIGFGPGRADAAAATKVTRSARAFSGRIEVLNLAGAQGDFSCNLSGTDTRSVTATIGTTNIGAGRTFTCAHPSGSQRFTLTHGIINTAAKVPNLSTGLHQFSLSYTPNGRNFFTCRTWTVSSSLSTVVTNTFATKESAKSSNGIAATCSDVYLQGDVRWTEGWSAS